MRIRDLMQQYHTAEEIRIRVNQAFEVEGAGFYERGEVVTQKKLDWMLNDIMDYSPYLYEEVLKRGFFTLPGGHRIGVVGQAVMNLEKQVVLGRITGLNIRIAKEVVDCARPLWSLLYEDKLCNVLIISSPGLGKTTLLRDLIRLLSQKYKVCVVDERSEIAACENGVPQFDLGPKTDVLDACEKRLGMERVLRSMSPQIIAVDEIGGEEEMETISQMLHSGIFVLATIHARDLVELQQKAYMKKLLKEKQFERFVVIENVSEQRHYHIYDQNGERMQ